MVVLRLPRVNCLGSSGQVLGGILMSIYLKTFILIQESIGRQSKYVKN